ncbi:L-threonylcarbamoyladenylate synthase [Hydrogenivirga sp.]
MPRVNSKVVREDAEGVAKSIEHLSRGDFVVAPTDTIYGILADALSYASVMRLRRLRRPSGRPFIVLIPDLSWVGKLGLEADKSVLRLLTLPKTTLVLKKRTPLYHWLGRDSLAVRYPRRGFIHTLLKRFGRPLVAPSANPEGKLPARDIYEAMEYFGEGVSVYVKGGKTEGSPSAVIRLGEGRIEVLRRGWMSGDSLRRVLERVNA